MAQIGQPHEWLSDLDVKAFPVSKSRFLAQRIITSEQTSATMVSIQVISHIMAHISPNMAPRLVSASANTCKYAECLL